MFTATIFDTAETVSVTSTAPTGQIFLEFDRAYQR